jgi:hypothetical protein
LHNQEGIIDYFAGLRDMAFKQLILPQGHDDLEVIYTTFLRGLDTMSGPLWQWDFTHGSYSAFSITGRLFCHWDDEESQVSCHCWLVSHLYHPHSNPPTEYLRPTCGPQIHRYMV